jgi:hypothetical protein
MTKTKSLPRTRRGYRAEAKRSDRNRRQYYPPEKRQVIAADRIDNSKSGANQFGDDHRGYDEERKKYRAKERGICDDVKTAHDEERRQDQQ